MLKFSLNRAIQGKQRRNLTLAVLSILFVGTASVALLANDKPKQAPKKEEGVNLVGVMDASFSDANAESALTAQQSELQELKAEIKQLQDTIKNNNAAHDEESKKLSILVGEAMKVASTPKPGPEFALNQQNTATDAGWNKPRNYWIIAFLSFGLMNFSGLFLHCLQSFPQETGISPLQRHFFWIGDCYTTGVFGVSLWAASMLESLPLAYYQQQQQQQQRQQNSTIQTGANDFCLWIQGCWIFANLFGIYAIIAFLVFGYKHDSLVPGTMLLETWYAVPATGFASTGLIYMLYQHWSVQLCAFYCLSLVMFVVATVGDAWFCRQFGTKYLDLLTTPTLFFAATDVVYIGLELWLEKRYSGVSSTKQKTG